MPNWDDPRTKYASAKAVFAWLQRRNALEIAEGQVYKIIYNWGTGKRNRRADIYAVDYVMQSLNYHLSELPDEVWDVPQEDRPNRNRSSRNAYGRFAKAATE